MEHISRIGLLKVLKEIAKNKQAAKLFEETKEVLPHNCPLRFKDTLHINALILVLEMTTDPPPEKITQKSICEKCQQGKRTICLQ